MNADIQLQQILSMLPTSGATPGSMPAFMSHSDSNSITPMANLFQSSTTPPSVFSTTSPAVQSHAGQTYGTREELTSPQNIASGRSSDMARKVEQSGEPRAWPKLPGFAPPVSLLSLAALTNRTTVSEHMASFHSSPRRRLPAIRGVRLARHLHTPCPPTQPCPLLHLSRPSRP